jgi:hypothetical protein
LGEEKLKRMLSTETFPPRDGADVLFFLLFFVCFGTPVLLAEADLFMEGFLVKSLPEEEEPLEVERKEEEDDRFRRKRLDRFGGTRMLLVDVVVVVVVVCSEMTVSMASDSSSVELKGGILELLFV